MKRIGIIVAIETDSLSAHYGKLEKLPCPSGFNLYILHKPNCDLYVLHTGVGEVAAAAGYFKSQGIPFSAHSTIDSVYHELHKKQ